MKEEISLDEKEKSRKIWQKQINKFFSENFKWLVVLVVMAVFAFGYFFLLKPKYDETVKYIEIINRQEEMDFENKKKELEKIKEFLSMYKGIDEKSIEKVNAIAPAKKNKEELFSQINYIVTRNGLFLQDISLDEGRSFETSADTEAKPAAGKDLVQSGEVERVTVNMRVRGADYESFKNFLSALENNLRLMDVISVNFDPRGGGISLVLNTYYTK